MPRRAATAEVLHHQWVVAAPPSAVLAHLRDPQSYVGLTPFVVRVRDVAAVPDATRYVAIERFRFLGLIRWDNPIRVTMRVQPDRNRLTQDVDSPGGVQLKSTVDLSEVPEGTRVQESIELSAPRPLRAYVRRQARAAQLYRAAELARRLAPQPHGAERPAER